MTNAVRLFPAIALAIFVFGCSAPVETAELTRLAGSESGRLADVA
jgi:hypothetical protein